MLLDTNILMNNSSILEKDNREFLVHDLVIQELDHKKNSRDGDVAYKARKASHYLMKTFGKWTPLSASPDAAAETVDDKLISIAKDLNLTLVTGDILMCLKCRLNGVSYKFYNKDLESYSGIQYMVCKLDSSCYNKQLDDMIQSGAVPEGMSFAENEFLIVTDENDNTLITFRFNNGKLNVVKNRYIKNNFVNSIGPKNREQACLFNLLADKNITIVNAQGSFGVGKSYITINYALQELESGNIAKIVFVPNNSFVKNAREHGFEPGTPLEKEMAFLGVLVDIMGEQYVTKFINNEQIEVVPLSVMRGRNFDNAIILVNEAENLEEDHIKLLIGRVGTNSKIIFDGDEKQADSSLFKNKSGLRLLNKLKDSEQYSKIFGAAKLIKVERSLTAQAADYLDTI